LKTTSTHFLKSGVLLLALTLLWTLRLDAQSITSFAPTSGPIGTIVTITGTGFNTTPAKNIVFFGATIASVTAATATQLTVTVPVGANYQYITATNTVTNLTAYSARPFNVTYNCGTSNYAAKVDFTVGTSPYLLAMRDLDGDGKPDLATANASTNNVSVLRNTSIPGALSFDPKVDIATGATALGVATGDFDGDGKPDLAITNQASATVSVLRNTSTPGTISFAAKVDFAVGVTTSYLFIGDLDGDGKPDLAVANQGAGTVSVLRNTSIGAGNISFAPKVDYIVGGSPNFDYIGDLDGDGKPDLAAANVGSASISTFRNTSAPGAISFAAKVDFATGTTPYGLTMSDIDGDGKLDLTSANWVDNNVSVLRNTSVVGNITFAARVNFAVTLTPHGISAGDLDGDGKPDLAVTNTAASSRISTLINTSTPGSITFSPKVDYVVTNNPYGIVTGDVDGDGKLDIVSTNTSSNSVSILRNTGNAASMSLISYAPTSGPVGTTVIITGTGFNTTMANDIVYFGATKATVTAASATSLTVTVPAGADYRFITVTNSGTNLTAYSRIPYNLTTACSAVSFAAGVSAQGGTCYWMETCDIDADGKADLVGPDYFAGAAAGLVITRNTSTPGTISFAAKSTFATQATQPCDATPGDFDGDGKPDVAVGGNGGGISVFRNTSTPGTISFAAKVDYATPGQDQDLSVSDFDGDGKPEIVSTNWSGNSVSVFRNISPGAGAISFAAFVTFAVGTQPWTIDCGDLDGDGKPDIVAGNFIGNSISILRNTSSCGTISFAPKVDYAAGTVPVKVHIGDIDGDGKADICVTVRDVAEVLVYRNLSTPGTISFAAGLAFALPGTSHYGVAIGDINGDGKPDIAAGNYTNNNTSYFINTSTPGTISFAARVDLATGGISYDVVIGDIDGDGRPDIVTQNTSNLVYVLRNTCTVLPIELLSFSGEPNGEDVLLQWSTASEINNDYFTVERSEDAADFSEIGRLKGAGNSNSLLDYLLVDGHPYKGINYYRLKQTDYDGKYTYSKTVAVLMDNSGQTSINIFPNPANTILNCIISLIEDGTVNISILDIVGNMVVHEELEAVKGSNMRQLDISNFPHGMYFIRISSRAENAEIKFVKE
jgi:hypothetical protein